MKKIKRYLEPENFNKELNIIKSIANNYNYEPNFINKMLKEDIK